MNNADAVNQLAKEAALAAHSAMAKLVKDNDTLSDSEKIVALTTASIMLIDANLDAAIRPGYAFQARILRHLIENMVAPKLMKLYETSDA